MSAVLPRRNFVRLPLLGGQAVEKNALDHLPGETGGVLLGSWDTPHLAQIKVVIGPGPEAAHDPFQPDRGWQQTQMARFQKAGRDVQYLGEWHVHHGHDTSPTEDDLRRADALRTRNSDLAPRLLMLIGAAREDGNFDLVPYVLHGSRLVRASLEWTEAPVIIWF